MATWASVMATTHTFQHKLVFYQTNGSTAVCTITDSSIYSLTITNSLFGEGVPQVGSCCSAILKATFDPGSYTIPSMAKVVASVMATASNGNTTAWYTLGTFWIDERNYDRITKRMDIVCYDAMLKAEMDFLSTGQQSTWPKTDTTVLASICTAMGVTQDSRNVINKGYSVTYPSIELSDKTSTRTCRELLSAIGVAYAGNWVITREGKLRLVPFATSSGSYTVNQSLKSYTFTDDYTAIGKVELYADVEAEPYTAGSSGRTFSCTCYFATQEMATNIRTAINGFVCKPYTASGAILDPLCELGDAVTIGSSGNTKTSKVASRTYYADSLGVSDISYEQSDEVLHEYGGYESAVEKDYKRDVNLARASFTLAIDSVISEVAGTYAPPYDIRGKYFANKDFVTHNDKFYKCISDTDYPAGVWRQSEWEEVTANEVIVNSTVRQTMDKIELSVSNSLNKSTITIMANGIAIDSKDVTFTEITADKLKLYGKMTMYKTNDFIASNVGGYIGYDNGYSDNGIRMMHSENTGQCVVTDGGAKLKFDSAEVYATATAVGLRFAPSTMVLVESGSLNTPVLAMGSYSFRPYTNGGLQCGTSSYRWSEIWCTQSSINSTSDRRYKTDIDYDYSEYESVYDKLKPARFKLFDSRSGRKHLGFIAQDVEDSLAECGVSSTDFAPFLKSAVYERELPDGEPDTTSDIVDYKYGLRYAELISLNTYMIQDLRRRVAELERNS